MANTSHTQMTVQGGNIAVIIPAVLVDGEVDSLGTPVLIEALESSGYTFKNPVTDTEVVSTTLENGVTVETETVSKVIDAKTGSQKAGSGADAFDLIKFRTDETARAAMLELKGLLGEHIFVCISQGFNPQGTSEGYVLLYGQITNDIEKAMQANQFAGVDVEITGRTGVASANFDESDLNGASGFGIGVEPMGGTAITKIIDTAAGTPNSLTSQELTDLLTGITVLKDIPVA